LRALCGGLSSLAGSHGSLGSITGRAQPAADEAADDVDVQCRSVAEVGRIDGAERRLIATVEALDKLDGRVAAGAEVERADLAGLDNLAALHLLQVAGGEALGLLGIAVADVGVDLAGVGGVCAVGVLNGAGALEGGAGIQEGRTVDLEWTLVVRLNDSWGSAAEITGERLDVNTVGGGGGVVSGSIDVSGIGSLSVGSIGGSGIGIGSLS
jgi:hypothetical protein